MVACDEKLKRVQKYLVWKTFKQQFLAENSILCAPLGNKLVDRHLGFCLSIGWYHSYNLHSIGFYIELSIDHYFRMKINRIVLGKNIIWCEEIIWIVHSNYIFYNWKFIFTPPTCSLKLRVTTSQLNNMLEFHQCNDKLDITQSGRFKRIFVCR